MRLVVFLLFLAAGVSARAETPDATYARCMALARTAPADALDLARSWRGKAAEHCEAVALMALARYTEAAARFRHLADGADAALRADLLAQEAQALVLDNQPEEAERVLTDALALRPDDPDLMVDRGVARAEQFRFADAVKDFDRAVARAPGDADAYLFRASALRKLDRLARARADVDAALRLNPRSPEGLLERGILKRLTGDRYGARADWVEILRAWPDTAAAEAAAVNIRLVDDPPELKPGEQPGTAPDGAPPAE